MKNKFHLAVAICFFSVVFMAMFMIDRKISILNKVSDGKQYVNFDEDLFEKDHESMEVATNNDNNFELVAVEDKEGENVAEAVVNINTKPKNIELKFRWPIYGDVVTKFSPDKFVFDKILDQYRTINEITIKTDKNNFVVSSEAGKVRKISDDVFGRKIEIEHMNGYVTTYSNMSNILVKENDKVIKGQEIGKCKNLDNENKYLFFGVKKDNKYLNPESIIK